MNLSLLFPQYLKYFYSPTHLKLKTERREKLHPPLPFQSLSEGIQAIFDALFLIVAFAKRRRHLVEMRDNLRVSIVSAVYFACLQPAHKR